MSAPLLAWAAPVENVIGLLLAVALGAYLVVALVKPERF